MSCNNGGKTTKKRVVVLASAASGIVIATYAAFMLTDNRVIAATVPTLLSLVACPAMCVGMGNAFWLARRFSRNNGNKHQIPSSKEEQHPCLAVVVMR